jgi:DNA-directed RNA polymerase subunit N (RpoN/RPB10)
MSLFFIKNYIVKLIKNERFLKIYILFQKMIILPIRCFTCNKILAHLTDDLEKEFPAKDNFFNKHNIKRYCCKRILMTSVNIFNKVGINRDDTFYKLNNSTDVCRIISTS